jgi:hypothetical protein
MMQILNAYLPGLHSYITYMTLQTAGIPPLYQLKTGHRIPNPHSLLEFYLIQHGQSHPTKGQYSNRI